MRPTCLIAIDPGKDGGIAWSLEDARTERVFAVRMPLDEQAIFDRFAEIEREALRKGAVIRAMIERATCRSAQGVKSVWTFSANYHGCRMAMVALGIPFRWVYPADWQRPFDLIRPLPKPKAEMTKQELSAHRRLKKQRSKEVAQELHPDFRVTHMTSEALLILAYFKKHTVR